MIYHKVKREGKQYMSTSDIFIVVSPLLALVAVMVVVFTYGFLISRP
jgi:hypothetical protein